MTVDHERASQVLRTSRRINQGKCTYQPGTADVKYSTYLVAAKPPMRVVCHMFAVSRSPSNYSVKSSPSLLPSSSQMALDSQYFYAL